MKSFFLISILILFSLFSLNSISAAHFIVGQVNPSITGVSANGRTIVLWNPTFGTSDNQTDIIGITGNSNQNNTYMIDCELLSHGCSVGNVLFLQVLNSGDNYNSANVSVTVTGAGFDIVSTINLNAPANISFINATSPIDLVANSTKQILCQAIARDPEGGPLSNASAQFFSSGSFYGDSDHNNYHYTNSSCSINSSFGGGNSQINCSFQPWYYANSGPWNCTILVHDNLTMAANASNSTIINPLLSVGINSGADYGLVNMFNISNEVVINVTNFGNVNINLSLYGYARFVGDGNAMNCTLGNTTNISVSNEKYNITSPTAGNINLTQFNLYYTNLSSNYTVRNFPILQRTNDVSNNAINTTYWRIYVPPGVSGNCTGNIVFGASTSPGV
jgi:hypothetical protein